MSKRSTGRARSKTGLGGRKWVFALGAVLFGVILFWRVEDTSPQRFALLALDEHPPGSATPYVPEAGRFPAFYLVRTEADDVYAIVRLAPASNCLVAWDEDEAGFVDPCNGRRYDAAGIPIGHGGAALYHLPIERSEIDMVMIDLGRRVPNPLLTPVGDG